MNISSGVNVYNGRTGLLLDLAEHFLSVEIKNSLHDAVKYSFRGSGSNCLKDVGFTPPKPTRSWEDPTGRPADAVIQYEELSKGLK